MYISNIFIAVPWCMRSVSFIYSCWLPKFLLPDNLTAQTDLIERFGNFYHSGCFHVCHDLWKKKRWIKIFVLWWSLVRQNIHICQVSRQVPSNFINLIVFSLVIIFFLIIMIDSGSNGILQIILWLAKLLV